MSVPRRWLGEPALAAAELIGFVVAFSYPVLIALGRTGYVWDWPEFQIRHWGAYSSLQNFRQIPLWNPYACGGMPMLAHPSSAVVTPMIILPLIFGPFVGLNLQIPAHLAIAWSGGYVMARVLGMGPLGKLTCASIFPASSWFYLHIGVGHLNFLPSTYIPWIAVVMIVGAGRRSLMSWVCGGLLLALMLGEGGVYQPTQMMILTLLMGLWLALAYKSFRPLLGIPLMFAFALGFAAVKLLPSLILIHRHPRPTEDLESSSVWVLLTGLFTRSQWYDRLRVEDWGFWELGAYLGPAASVLAVVGLIASLRRAIPWMLFAALFFILALGAPRPWFPWALLHRLPFMSLERMPERFLILFVFAIGVVAAYGADYLARVGKPFGAIAAVVVLLAGLADAWMVSSPNMTAPVAEGPPIVNPQPQFVQRFEDPWSQLTLARSNIGALHCNESLDYQDVDRMKVVASNQPGYRGEQYLLGPGTLTLSRWTPNALSYDINTPTPNVLVINQNYDANWRAVQGLGEVFSYKGLLAVHLPAGIQHVRLVFRSNAFELGAVISLLTCVIALSLWVHERRRRMLENQPTP
jgi:hypothetical protein